MKKSNIQTKWNNKGITLIALVITIIVLLILAGVSIATLTGENGILNRASDSSIETRGGSVQEQVDLWNNDKSTYKYADGEKPETLEHLLDRLVEDKLLTEAEKATIIETGEITIGKRTIIFGKGNLLPAVDPNNETEYFSDLTINGNKLENGWRYFCSEDDRVILIYESCIPVKYLTIPETDTIEARKYSVYSNMDRDDLLNYLNGEGNYTTAWDTFKSEIKNSLSENGVIVDENQIIVKGAITTKQLEKAYNERYSEEEKKFKVKYFSEGTENPDGDEVKADGYLYSFQPNGTEVYEYDIFMQGETVWKNELFFPQIPSPDGDGVGFWLADFSAGEAGRLCYMRQDGWISFAYYYDSFYGVRPTISLPKTVFETN